MKEVSCYGKISLGQTVNLNRLEFAPNNSCERLRHFKRVNGQIEDGAPSFDVSTIGKVIKLEEVETGCWATVEVKTGGVRKLHIDERGIDRGNFGSLSIIRDCYQLEISV
jgi:hypothetical protein